MKILFICTGNICRSPTAHAIARHQAKLQNVDTQLFFDSAGTDSYHSGELPDARSAKVGEERGISFSNMTSRQMIVRDFDEFDLILAMTKRHLQILQKASPAKYHHKIKLFLPFCGVENEWNDDVIDPYYGGDQGFLSVFDMIELGVKNLIAKLTNI